MPAEPWIMGISASHNGSACLLKGGRVVVAVQEERLTGIKRSRVLPGEGSFSIPYCLEVAGITPKELDLIVVCPTLAFDASENDVTRNPLLFTDRDLPVLKIPHHLGHAYSAFATSGFSNTALLVIDGAGSFVEDCWPTEQSVVVGPRTGREIVSLYEGRGHEVLPVEKHLSKEWLQGGSAVAEILLPHPDKGEKLLGMPRFGSLGGMYSAVAKQIFGNVYLAGKVMGLAPYGEPTIPVDEFFTISDGSLLFQDTVPKRFSFHEPFPMRREEYENLAASVQAALEQGVLYFATRLREKTGQTKLAYAGGVALNSILNEKLMRSAGFEEIFIIPAAEDSGPAIGAAYYGLWTLQSHRTKQRVTTDSLGKVYPSSALEDALQKVPCLDAVKCIERESVVVDLLCEGKFVGWFQGGSEFGPRALGHRSILCDPRHPDAKRRLNERIKHREEFRPFAPAILLDEVEEWFDLEGAPKESPFMLRIFSIRAEKQALVPAVVHCDGTARVQTVTRSNGAFYELLRCFAQKTGVPILLNTSFNVMGEPIVETPEDALWSLLFTGLDYCVIGEVIVQKKRDFCSPLDLIPHLCIDREKWLPKRERWGLSIPIEAEQSQRSLYLPWEYESFLLALPSIIDGIRDGWAVKQALSQWQEVEWSELQLIRTLAVLRRSGFLTLKKTGQKR